ncbi:phosphatase PAP2 family protein [Pedobacter sp. PAMC26386]|nr:phosphatase PAP2 family protein [Pedobacter sp. PAMC26386]
MWKLIRYCPFFFSLLALMLVVGIGICLEISKLNSFIFLNFYHCDWLDYFFSYYTLLGDGLFSILVIVVVYFWKERRLALILLIAFLSSGIISQLIKRLINDPRPCLYFEQISFQYPYLIKGISKLSYGSFPSGHTATIFAMLIIFVLYFGQKRISLLFLLLAVLVGYSRIYLSHHFLQDVVAGAVIGSISGLLSYYFCSMAGSKNGEEQMGSNI